ncbi:MAG: ABC transporter permease subunit, partial [Cellvibrionaceae bacterium]|nr:ABC transporter permease subunit [Cellvibrionaceae bacterium]
ALLYLGSAELIEFDVGTLIQGAPHLFDYLADIMPQLETSKLLEPRDANSHAVPGSLIYWGYRLPIQLRLIWETLNMAFAATLVAAALSLLLSFLCTRNMGVWPPLRLALRSGAIFLRTMPELAWAIMLVMAFGVGPFPGFLALVLHTTGCMVKLFYEALEATQKSAVIGLTSCGASKFQLIRFAYWPAFKPTFISYLFLRLEINFRASS